MVDNDTSKNFNEVGVVAFMVACYGTLNSLPSIFLMLIRKILSILLPDLLLPDWLFGLGRLFTFFGYAFCATAFVLSICAYVDIFKHNKRGYYGYSIAGTCMAILGPIAMIGIRVLIAYLLYI